MCRYVRMYVIVYGMRTSCHVTNGFPGPPPRGTSHACRFHKFQVIQQAVEAVSPKAQHLRQMRKSCAGGRGAFARACLCDEGLLQWVRLHVWECVIDRPAPV